MRVRVQRKAARQAVGAVVLEAANQQASVRSRRASMRRTAPSFSAATAASNCGSLPSLERTSSDCGG